MTRTAFTLTDDMRNAVPADAIGDWESPPERKRQKRPEDVLHTAVAKMLRAVLAPEVVWWSSESRGVGMIEGAKRKARGVLIGTPDMQVMHDGRTIFIELKAPGRRLSAEQVDLHCRLRNAGFVIFVCWSINDVFDNLRLAGIPTRGRIQ